MSLRQAQADGLQLGAGCEPGPAKAASAQGLDADTATLLASGLGGAQDQVRLSQALPNGQYDIELWIAGAPADGKPKISLAGRETVIGGTAPWRRIGPLRTTVSGRSLELAATLPAGARLAGLGIRAIGAGDGPLPPTVFLTAPVDDASVAAPGTATLKAEAFATDGAIRTVEFYADAVKIGEALAAPYACTWNYQAAGTYHLSAQAITVGGGRATSASVAIQVKEAEKAKPGLALAITEAGAALIAPATVTLSASPSHVEAAIDKVEFFAGVNKLGEAVAKPFQLTWDKIAPGDYMLTATATIAGGGLIKSEPLALSVAPPIHAPPTVAIESPGWGDEVVDTGRLAIRVKAAAAEGKVVKVEFFADELKIGETAAPPFSFTWLKPEGGTHQLTAAASDDRGGRAVSEATLVIVGKSSGFTLLRGINLGGPAIDVEGGHWLSQEQAQADGLALSPGRPGADQGLPAATAEGSVAMMLATSFQSDQDELKLSQEIADGVYQVALWMYETKAANAHVCDIEIQGVKQPQLIGRLGKGTWAKYGPYLAKVRNQELSVVLRAKGPTPPKIMGLAIYAPPSSVPANRGSLRQLVTKADAVVSQGLLAWFNASAGVSAVGAGVSRWADQSGNGHHAGQDNPANRPRLVNKELNNKPALAFKEGDALELANSRDLDPEALTLIAWVRQEVYPTGGEARRWLIGKNGNELISGHFSLLTNRDRIAAYFNNGGGPEHSGEIQGAALVPRAWHQLTATCDGTRQLLYVDAAKVAERALDRKRIAGTGPIIIGRRPDLWGEFGGQLDEVRVYDRALGESEIRLIEQHLRARFFTGMNTPVALNLGFVGGQEFPGARGGLTRDGTVAHGSSASFKLNGDFTGGGVYVGVWMNFPALAIPEVKELHLWLKAGNLSQVGVRIVDASDQCHQRHVQLAKGADWQELVLLMKDFDGVEHWGGANDGKWHGQIKGFGLNISQDKTQKLPPTLWIDDLGVR